MTKEQQANPRGVFERPPGSRIYWISYFDAEGKWHREKVGRKSIAITAYHNRKREIREGKFVPPMERRSTILFTDLLEQAIEAKKGRQSHLSVAGDEWRKRRTIAALGSQRASTITSLTIETWLATLHKQGLSGPTVNRYRSLVSSVFSFGIRTGKVDSNPVSKVPRYKENEGRVRFLSAAEERKLREAIRNDYPEREAEIDLALHTGMRRGEQFSLKWEQVDFERGMVTVSGKTGRRFIPLNRRAHQALLVLRKQSRSAYVCPEAQSDRQRDWRRWFEDSVREAGIQNLTWHDLRHTFASRLVMAGKDLRSVQELLGHKSVLMTMRYAHLSPAHLKNAVEALCNRPRSHSGRPGTTQRRRKASTTTKTNTGHPKRRRKMPQVF